MFPPAPVSPRRCTCIAYADIDTVYLVFPSLPPRALFFVVTAEVSPKWVQPASRHLRALQTRNCPSDSGYRVSDPPLHPPLPPSTYIRIQLSLVPGIPFFLPPPFSPQLTRIATIQTILVIVVTLVTAAYSCYFVYSRYRWLTLAGEIRGIARARCAGIITAFFLILSHSPSGIWRVSNFFNKHDIYIYRRSKNTKFCRFPQECTLSFVIITLHASTYYPFLLHEMHLANILR